MARDLFAETVGTRPAPKRTTWTIAGSILAHAGFVIALLIIPILSAANSIVALAQDIVFIAPALPAAPATPSAPPPKSPVAADINPAAAPPSPPVEAVTRDATPAVTGPVVPGGIPFGNPGVGVPGVAGSSSTTTIATAPPEPKPTPVRPGGDIKPPERVSFVEPAYPTLAMQAKIQDYVILEATIDESGRVQNVRVLKSAPLFDAAAIAAVSKWRYTPTFLNGRAVPVLLTVTVRFSLNR